MKIINVIGGLGNQMFCYAFAISLKYKYNDDVLVDISHFKNYNLHDGFQINEIFNINDIKIADKKNLSKVTRYVPHYFLSRLVRKLLPSGAKEYVEKYDYTFDENVFKIKTDCYYEGYWQSPLYFDNFREVIKDKFVFPEPTGENHKLSGDISKKNSVSIHVRRGDYLYAKSFMGICELDYYLKAITEVKSKIESPHFYIFSNDIDWCKDNFKDVLQSDEMTFVVHNLKEKSFWDMYLMSCCKNMILANSSFSWWAAYLNKNSNAFIVSPRKWVNRDYKTQIHLGSWTLI